MAHSLNEFPFLKNLNSYWADDVFESAKGYENIKYQKVQPFQDGDGFWRDFKFRDIYHDSPRKVLTRNLKEIWGENSLIPGMIIGLLDTRINPYFTEI